MRSTLMAVPLIMALNSASARAEEAPADRWSLGVGIASSVTLGRAVSGGGFAGVAGVSGSPDAKSALVNLPVTVFSVAVERKLRGALWLQASLSGSYSTDEDASPVSFETYPAYTQSFGIYSKRQSNAFGIQAGPLYWFNPGGSVEFGNHADVGASRSGFSLEGIERTISSTSVVDQEDRSDGWGYSVYLTGGIAAQLRLVKHLWLRLSSSLAYVSFEKSKARVTVQGLTRHADASGLNTGFHVVPALELRLTF